MLRSRSYIISQISYLKRLRRRIFFIALPILIVFGPIVAYLILNAKPAQASWFNNNWSYRKPITVTNSTGSSVSNLEKLFSINTSTLVSAGKLQTSCNDMRFTNQSGKLLPYYIDSGCNTTNTKVWVLIDSLPTTTSTIYMYYGNPSASQGSNSSAFDNVVGLVGYWTMNDGSGTTAVDSSINNDNGTLSGSTDVPTWTNPGKFGQDLTFDGTDDFVNIPYNFGAPNVFTISMWFKTTATSGVLFDQSNVQVPSNPTSYVPTLLINSNGTLRAEYWTGGEAAITTSYAVNDGNWHFISFVGNTNTQSLYVDGKLIGSRSGTLTQSWWSYSAIGAGYVDAGRGGTNAFQYFNGQIDDVHVYTIARTAQQISNDYFKSYAIQSAGTNITYSFGSETQAPGPIAYWKFDEGYGTTAHDATTNQNDQTITSASWQQKDQCVSGKCLYFDGSSAYLQANNSNVGNFGTNDFTISYWIKALNGTQNQYILSKRPACGNSSFWNTGINSSGKPSIELDQDSSGTNYLSTTATDPITDGNWHFITYTRSGTSLKIYIDGLLNQTGTDTGTANISNSTSLQTGTNICVGSNGSVKFKGFLDEIKIFDYARSASQILSDYNATLAGGGSAVLGATANQNLSNGLVGYWKMDEASWNGTAGEVKDSSGNGNNGTSACSGTGCSDATTTAGKFGNGGSFVGTTSVANYVNAGTSTSLNPTNDITVAAWINPSSSGNAWDSIISRNSWSGSTWTNSAYNLALNKSTGAAQFSVSSDGTTLHTVVSANSTISNGSWQFVVGTYDGQTIKLYINGSLATLTSYSGSIYSSTASTVIGSDTITSAAGTQDAYYGLIDEARIYNRALSPSEVATLYNYAPGPVAYYNFNEGQGNTTNDTSGNNNTGTFYNSPLWTTGKYGKGVKFNGSNSYVGVPDTTNLEYQGGNFTYGGWLNINPLLNAQAYAISKPWNGNGSYNYSLRVDWDGRTPRCGLAGNNNYSIPGTPLTTGWHYVVCTADSSGNLILYVDGVKEASGNYSSTITSWTPGSGNTHLSLVIGSLYPYGQGWGGASGDTWLGTIDDVRIYNYTRTQKQIVQDMNGGHPAGGSPVGSQVGYWKFDEGYGTTAHDYSPQLNNATINSATWTNDGKFDKALSFNGTSSYVDAGNPTSLQLTSGTITAWIKTSNAGSGFRGIVAKQSAYGMFLYNNQFAIYDWGSSSIRNSGVTLSDGKWHYVAVTFQSGVSNGTILYIDGVPQLTTTMTVSSNTVDLQIGWANAAGQNFTGTIDEVKVYNSPLTAQEILIDYNHGSAVSEGSLGTDASGNPSNSADRSYCPPGDTTASCSPIGEWNFDEGQGTAVNDSTGNGDTGTWNGSGPNHWVNGYRFGKAGNFNGTDDYVSLGDPSNLQPSTLTVEAWFKTTSSNGMVIVRKRGYGYGLQIGNYSSIGSAGKVTFWIDNSTPTTYSTTSSQTYNDGKWHYAIGIYDGSTVKLYIDGSLVGSNTAGTIYYNAGGVSIGRDGDFSGGYFNGAIDQVRIYNYARTAAQAAWDYNQGKPIAEWKFDECQGTAIYDSTGDGNNGTFNGESNPGTCTDGTGTTAWSRGSVGKINSSLYFDGTDDYISFPSWPNFPGSNFSVSAWYQSVAGDFRIGIQQYCGAGPFALDLYNNGASFSVTGATGNCSDSVASYSSSSFNSSNWHLAIGTFDGTNARLYVDGVLQATGTNFTGSYNNNRTEPFVFGRNDCSVGCYFAQGKIDDTRVYNYALTSQQIKSLYNNGAIFYGPATGTP